LHHSQRRQQDVAAQPGGPAHRGVGGREPRVSRETPDNRVLPVPRPISGYSTRIIGRRKISRFSPTHPP